MITAGYVVCNESELIAESIRSVKAYVDGFVFVDVVFDTNPIRALHSTDSTKEIALSTTYPVPTNYIEATAKMSEVEARNAALALVQGWVLVVDGDETLYGLFSEPDEERAYGVAVYTTAVSFNGHAPDISENDYQRLPVISTKGYQPRLFPVAGMEYRESTGAPGLWHDGERVAYGKPDVDWFLVNHRTRQTYAAYQGDYVWESAR